MSASPSHPVAAPVDLKAGAVPRVLNLAEAAAFARCSRAHLCNVIHHKVPRAILRADWKPLPNSSWRWPIASQRSQLRLPIPQANRVFEVNEVKRDEVEFAKL
jgi:hypothetical protein